MHVYVHGMETSIAPNLTFYSLYETVHTLASIKAPGPYDLILTSFIVDNWPVTSLLPLSMT